MTHYSFDFDGTLQSYDGKPMMRMIGMAKKHMANGDMVSVITRRSPDADVINFVRKHLGKIPIVFTDGEWKHTKINSDIHHDDDPIENDLIKKNTNTRTIQVDDDQSPERLNKIAETRKEVLGDTSILVIDGGGLYINIAQRLTKEFADVYYFCSWKGCVMFAESYKKNLGMGIPYVTRVDSIEQVKNKVDVIFFPDCQHGDTQMDLQEQGYRCFGGGSATKLENNRKYFKDKLKEWGLPVGPYVNIRGVDNLIEYIKSVKDLPENKKYVKISETRGDMETYCCKDEFNATRFFLEQKLSMGLTGETRDFIVEDEMEGTESGIDTYIINGEMPKNICAGYELKDSAYIGRMINRDALPQGMKDINDKLCSYIKENDVATFVSTENRVNDNFYLTDPTMRCPCPPNECTMTNTNNYGFIIRKGADGELEEPAFKKEYAAQIILKSDDAITRELHVSYDKQYQDNVHFYNYCMRDGEVYTIPMNIPGHNVICSVVGLGATLEEAQEECLEIAKTVKTDGIYHNPYCFNDVMQTIVEGSKAGVNIFD